MHKKRTMQYTVAAAVAAACIALSGCDRSDAASGIDGNGRVDAGPPARYHVDFWAGSSGKSYHMYMKADSVETVGSLLRVVEHGSGKVHYLSGTYWIHEI